MTVKPPTTDEVISIAAELGMTLSDANAEEYLGYMSRLVEAYDGIDAMSDGLPAAQTSERNYTRPTGEENKFNAWVCKTSIKGAPSGRLAGHRVAIKDNISVAGIPLSNGAAFLDGCVPEIDATVVTRILEAGGEVAGKAQCEFLSSSGGSHTVTSGPPVQNPWKTGYTTGGSSSGSAALVAAGDVTMALGCDQAGSIRVPSSYSGICGMKATRGLVPYTGIMPIDMTLDHCGPMTDTVANNALLLEAIAGPDGFDPRQQGVEPDAYTEALNGDAAGLKIGILEEGFGHFNSEPGVEQKVKDAASLLEKLGCQVSSVSIPIHRQCMSIWAPIGIEGTHDALTQGSGYGAHGPGVYVPSLLDSSAGWRDHADDIPETMKYVMILGRYMSKSYGRYYYGKAQNLARTLRASYDEVLAEMDLLIMPTVPTTATPIPPPDAPLAQKIQRAHDNFANPPAFDVTGHPALSIPCGLSDGLPVGLMLVGKHYDETTIYRAAHAFEQAEDWRQK